MSRIPRIVLVAACFLAACSPSREEMQAEIDQLKGSLDESATHAKSLQGKIAELEGDIADRDERIAALESDKASTEAELKELRAEQAQRVAELQTYKDLFARLKKLIDAGTIKVTFRKGRMIVELASAVLFDSGKTELKEAGQVAIEELVAAFQTVADRDLLVAGHTDNIPFRGRRFRSNWDLSTARAVEVVNHMIEKGFPAAHLGAAGFGEMDPVGDNNTEEGRAANRRIEIILMPNLGELKGIKEMLAK